MNLQNYEITVEQIMQNPRAKMLLQRELPAIINHPMFGMAGAIPLKDIVRTIECSGNFFARQKMYSVLQKLSKI